MTTEASKPLEILFERMKTIMYYITCLFSGVSSILLGHRRMVLYELMHLRAI